MCKEDDQLKMQNLKCKIERGNESGSGIGVVSMQVVDFPLNFNESSELWRVDICKIMILRRLHLEDFALLQVIGFSPVIAVFHDFSSFFSRFSSCSTLISRRLGRIQGFFEGFLALKGIDFSSVTEILPVFLIMPKPQQARRGAKLRAP
jgi:hypothetical protein